MQHNSLYRAPNPVIYGFLAGVSKLVCKYYFRMKIIRNELKGSSGRRVLIANHESAMDFLTTYAAVPFGTHAITSRSIMHSMPLCPLMESCGIIAKNQFQTSVRDMKKMRAVLDHDALLMFYPAGLMTESGMSTPIPPATAKTLKWFDADIYVAKVSGTYLTNPKWAKVKRRGKITLDIYKLATREEFAALAPEEAKTLVEQHLSFDAYRDNEKKQTRYQNGDNVEGLENVLYQCPSCGAEFTMQVRNKHDLACTACGYQVRSDRLGLLSKPDGQPAIFRYPSDWHAHIEQNVFDHIRSHRDFLLETEAQIFKINEKKHCYEPVGSGFVTLNYDCFTIDGTVHGKPFSQEFPTASYPMLPFKPGKCFEIQHGSDIFRIQPKDGRIVMKWILTLKSAYRLRNLPQKATV